VTKINIIKVTQVGQRLYFTAINKDGNIKIGMRDIKAKKVEWFDAII